MLVTHPTEFELTLPNGTNSRFHHAWLRDNCPCSDCRHPSTHERLLVTASIADNIAPLEACLSDNQLQVHWNDGHHSRYELSWLVSHNYAGSGFSADQARGTPTLWGSELKEHIPEFHYHDLRNDEQSLLDWCCAIRDYGLAIVRDAPRKEGEIERFANHVGCVRETIYDRLHNVRATPEAYNAYNVASTTLELKPHTDMPNYYFPPGVQMFHFLLNESEGGESTAVDGFKVAAQLKLEDPEAYHVLATTPVTWQMFSARGDIVGSHPHFTLDAHGKLAVFRFSNQLLQPVSLPADQVDAFYRAYRLLGRLTEDPAFMVRFKLGSGDMMATNNLRVMHGRTAFNPHKGGRHLQLSYMDLDDVLSRIRMIKRRQEQACTAA